MFFGDPTTLPTSWKLCDGSVVNDSESPLDGHTLPDLRSSFVRGESSASYDPLLSGLHSGGSDDIPAHSHTETSVGDHTHSNTLSVTGHTHSLSGTTGYVSMTPGSTGVDYECEDDQAGWGTAVHLDVSGGTVSEGQHFHNLAGSTGSATASLSGSISAAGGHTHTINSASFSSGANIPHYVALHYIIRIK